MVLPYFFYLSPQSDKTLWGRLQGVYCTHQYAAGKKKKSAMNWKTCLKKAQMGSTIASEVPCLRRLCNKAIEKNLLRFKMCH